MCLFLLSSVRQTVTNLICLDYDNDILIDFEWHCT
jgi:hypothetical protein